MHQHPIFHHVADDSHRGRLVQHAIRKGIEQARGDFFYALLTDGLGDEGVALCAGEAWNAYHRQIMFDYPHFAEKLFLHAYRAAYRRHLQDVANGRHADPVALAHAIDLEFGLAEP